MSSVSKPIYDVAIVGAGLIGSTLALALGRAGLSVALIDRRAGPERRAAEHDERTTAVALGSRRILESVGAWRDSAIRGGPILDIRVSDGSSTLHLHYDHRTIGPDPLGHIVPNHTLRSDLDAALRETPSVDDLAPAAVVEIERTPQLAQLTLADGSRVSATLVIGTDGRRSAVAKAARIRSVGWSYGQTALVTLIRHSEPHRGIAHERFLRGGPLALLPLTDPHACSVVWTETNALAQHLAGLDPAKTAEEMEARFGPWLGRFEIIGRRQLWPLSFHHAAQYVAPRLALAGDAAHGIHPIAGQGANLGWRDAAALAEVLVDARRLGLDIGALDVLRRYQSWRRPDTLALSAATDGLNRLFSNDFGPLRLMRDVGMATVNRIAPLKQAFMLQAMGIGGRLPRLAKGEVL